MFLQESLYSYHRNPSPAEKFLFLPRVRELCYITGPFQGTDEWLSGTKIISDTDKISTTNTEEGHTKVM